MVGLHGTTPQCDYWLFIFPSLSLMYVCKEISNAYVSYSIYTPFRIYTDQVVKSFLEWFFHIPYLHLQVSQIHQCLWSEGQCNSCTFVQLKHTHTHRHAHGNIQTQAHSLRWRFPLHHEYLWHGQNILSPFCNANPRQKSWIIFKEKKF